MKLSKKELFKVLGNATSEVVADLAKRYVVLADYAIIRQPEKQLMMLPMREPAKERNFYIGEVLVCEAMVEKDGIRGYGLTMGDDFEKTFHIALLDCLSNQPEWPLELHEELLIIIKKQRDEQEFQNGRIALSMVNFETMEGA